MKPNYTIQIETVSCPCNTCCAGYKKYATRRSRVTYLLQPARSRAYQKHVFLFLLLIYMRFLTIFYAKTMGLFFIVDV